ncbi:hypothetical protein ACVIN2_005435 [Bradyrhizobium sp. USDA 3650]
MMISRLLGAVLAALILIAPAAATDAELAKLARASGTPDIPGLKMVWLAPWGDVGNAKPWRNIIVHQTEGPAGSARGGAQEQAKNPTRRGVTLWVETDGTVYWAVAENLVPTHGDGANRNDNKYIDNKPTYRQVGARQFDRRRVRRQLSRRHDGPDRGAGRGVEDPGPDPARALRHPARPRLCAQLDRLQGRPLLRRLLARDAGADLGGKNLGGMTSYTGSDIQPNSRRIKPGRRGSSGGSSTASTRLKK